MNINKMRNAVLQGNIATCEEQIRIWEIYSDRTDEVVTTNVTEIEQHIADLEAMII